MFSNKARAMSKSNCANTAHTTSHYCFSLERTFRAIAITCFLLFSCIPFSVSHAEIVELKVRVLDSTDQQQIHPFTTGDSIAVDNGRYLFQLVSSKPVARMRVTVKNASCPIGRLGDIANNDDPQTSADDDLSRRFDRANFTLEARESTCDFRFDAWYENYQWAGKVDVSVEFAGSQPNPEPNPDPETTLFTITQGTARSTALDTSSPMVDEPFHGTRIYCPVSHFSYDDPVVHPGRPGAAHLHVFWGNTATDAFSTLESLFSDGLSSCEGGLNNKSAYWMPAMFNEQHEVVLPESVVAYYKSFGSTPGFDRNSIMPIPNGLEMLANASVKHSGPWNFVIEPESHNGQQLLRIKLLFPQCLQVDTNGNPILSSPDNISHLSYSSGSGANSADCPVSHPYRIPQLSYNARYRIPVNSGWYLSSDASAETQGQSLHGDYIAAWDDTTMNRIVKCNRESRRECQFIGFDENGRPITRTQLPERFLSPDGEKVYATSFNLSETTDRTPFGKSLKRHQ